MGKAIKKVRHKEMQQSMLDDFASELKRGFTWVVSANRILSPMPTVAEAWNIKFSRDIMTNLLKKDELEYFIQSFMWKRGNRGSMFCWQHRGVVVIAF